MNKSNLNEGLNKTNYKPVHKNVTSKIPVISPVNPKPNNPPPAPIPKQKNG
jgi:hypothetical protein